MRRLRSALALLVGAVLTVGALAIPAITYTRLDGPDLVLDRHGAPTPTWSDDELRALIEDQPVPVTDRPLILSYHDVRPDPPRDDRYTVSPEQLADHLAMLRVAGYESIGVDDLVAWLDGTASLPPRAVVLTFDDGASGLWRHADAVLEDQGFEAVAFPITGRVGTNRPYYLTWQELEHLRDSGRWDVESHTQMGHDRITIDAEGTRWPFLINRAWVAGEDRLETAEEFAARVDDDLTGSMDDLVDHGFAAPRLFAYPFSAETNPTNDPTAPVTTNRIVADRFEASMTNVVPDRLVSERDRARRSLPRLEVFRATTVEALLARIVGAVPTEPGPAEPLASPGDWTDSAGEPLVEGAGPPDVPETSEQVESISFGDATLTITPPTGDYVGANHAPGRSADWSDYGVQATVSGLGRVEGGPTGSLFALVGSDSPVQVAVSATYVRVSTGADEDARQVLAEHTLRAADTRRIEIDLRAGSLVVSVDGEPVATAPVPAGTTGGIGVAASDGPLTFSSVSVER